MTAQHRDPAGEHLADLAAEFDVTSRAKANAARMLARARLAARVQDVADAEQDRRDRADDLDGDQ
ncbi:hypothetical protein AB0B89_31050 [Sphaerisporangium sp. NPDC049002]|uniref:hypothetical protein n=1 Tax=Sphaerisporangium sp. NPDC049002 TaxID=3155392 RepID=UPI0033F2B406